MNIALERIRASTTRAKELRHLNFIITETFDLAEKHCEEAVQNGKQPFEIIVKDNFAVKNVPMTCASKMLKDFIAPYTATCVERLLINGGCLIGKSNMDEFAIGSTCTNGCFGPVKHSIYANKQLNNELEDDFVIAGGSSGGCAVAVAIGVAKCALASDTGGSTRYPAVLNGVFGFKPSYGHLSRYGLVPLANSLDTPSIIAKSISECKHYFEIMKGNDPMDITTLPNNLFSQNVQKIPKNLNQLTIGIIKYERNNLLSKAAENSYLNALNLLSSKGVKIKEVNIPHLDFAVNCYSIIVDVEVASNMARFDGIRYGYCSKEHLINDDSFISYITRNRTESLGSTVKRRIFSGNFYSLQENYNKYVNKAAKIQRLLQKDFNTAFTNNNLHCILTPVSRHSAPLFSQIKKRSREEQRLDDYFMAPTNLCGLPSIGIPFSKCSHGLPLGIQLISPYLEDFNLLEISQMFVNLFE